MRIRASTLIETVASMAIIGCVLAVSGLIFTNVLRSDRSLKRTQAGFAIAATTAHWSKSAATDTDPQEVDGLTVRSTWKPLADGRRQFHFSVVDREEHIVLEQDRILPGPWNE